MSLDQDNVTSRIVGSTYTQLGRAAFHLTARLRLHTGISAFIAAFRF